MYPKTANWVHKHFIMYPKQTNGYISLDLIQLEFITDNNPLNVYNANSLKLKANSEYLSL
jgi:hypothetical protein